MKTTSILSAVIVAGMLFGAAGCTKRDDTMGPAEKAGRAVDKTVESVGEKVTAEMHDKLDKADQAAKNVAKAAQDTTDKISQATEDASKGLNKATEEVGKKVERAGEKIQESAHNAR